MSLLLPEEISFGELLRPEGREIPYCRNRLWSSGQRSPTKVSLEKRIKLKGTLEAGAIVQ